MFIHRSKAEEKIIKFWKEKQIFKKSLEKQGGDFVFYEGPPTANAKPGVHHALARAFKDVICRYQTMRGKRVLRKAGWDVHGLPVELATEKELGLKNKKDIEKYGIAKFNQKCEESVWRHAQEWTKFTERIGYWLDLDNPYITSDPFYMESVFNIIKQISDRGLLYQGYKVVPYCPRCGTTLSSHEVAQGYKKVKETAIYVKFELQAAKFEADLKTKNQNSKIYLLVWTTTPWTLPANVAVAINPDITYVLAEVNKEHLIVAKKRQEVLGDNIRILKEFKGKDLVNLNYKPLFNKKTVTPLPKSKKIYKILAAGFVSTEEGTGLVHIAPAFGQDDMELVRAQNIECKAPSDEIPIPLTVDEEGKFKKEVKKWKGKFVKEADPLIVEHLQKEGFLFKSEQYEHDYPFCWRCCTPLLYYAKKSWFIGMSKIKKKMIKNNQQINWIPAHIQKGRFGEWLKDVKDWALSRERYWGTPLPIWECESCGHREVIGNRDNLRAQKFTTNNYFILRHGEALSNTKNINSGFPEKEPNPLTQRGKEQIRALLPTLESKKIDLIFASDLLRTKMTAEIVGKFLGIAPKYDKRLRELGYGEFNGKSIQESRDFYNPDRKLSVGEVIKLKFEKPLPGGETYLEVKERILEFIKELNQKYQNKNILIVSHEAVLTMLETFSLGMTIEESAEFRVSSRIQPGEMREIDFNIFPYNEKGEIDFHRPHIDKIQFLCPKCGKPMKRVPEVIDCWFDSGSMPFAQGHWPFADNDKLSIINDKLTPPKLFPADYIAEAVDQTRGWFYTLLGISTLLGFESPYKNVIVLGHILDEKGQKMSKSKGNVVDPWMIIRKYGADALRWYFYTVNQPGDVKLFSEKDVDQALKKFIMTFWNCYAFFKTYAQNSKFKIDSKFKIQNSKFLLDRWVLSKLNGLVGETTKKLDDYDITGAARAIETFVINNLSLWYIRRSRKRFQKPDNGKELEEASATLYYVLFSLAKLTAPFAPFVSEEIYRGLSSAQSVHLKNWPRVRKEFIDKEIEKGMEVVRRVVALGLKIRSDQGIKVRQPLLKLKIQILNVKSPKFKINNKEFIELIKEELNVKEVEVVETITKENGWIVGEDENLKVALNTKITVELKEEGMVRETVRQIQQMRKSAGLKPEDKIAVYYSTNKEFAQILERYKKGILDQVRAINFEAGRKEKGGFKVEKELELGGQKLWLGIKIIVR